MSEFWALTFATAFRLFMVLDPPGNVGPVAALLAPYDSKKASRILVREIFIALAAMFLFYLAGGYFLEALGISKDSASVEITGGIVFGFVGIGILFPRQVLTDGHADQPEPFIVPIAIPLIAGPSCLATLITYSQKSTDMAAVLIAIPIAWASASVFILLAPLLARKIGKNGLRAAEQFIGVICIFLALQTILKGVAKFLAQ
jgi:multiple antibiotic resistance protein